MKWYWSKYPTWVKVLVIIGVVIGIGMALWDGFEGSKKAGTSSQTKEPTSLDNRKANTEIQEPVLPDNRRANTETTSNDLKIKGFYLGMNIDDAANLLGEYVKFRPEVELLINHSFAQKSALASLFKNAPNTEYAIASFGGFHIEADSDKKVTRIAFFSDFSNKLFNSIDMDIETFIENFKKAYRIPDFKLIVTENNDTYMPEVTYEYSSPDGYKITIGTDKGVEIKSIPKPTERGFD